MTEQTWMKQCCGLCPFAREGTLALRPDRAEDFAYMAENPYTDFPCHKTADYHESDDGGSDGYYHGEKSLTCHGFKTLQMAMNATDLEYKDQGFKADGKGFEDTFEMIETHENLWADKQ